MSRTSSLPVIGSHLVLEPSFRTIQFSSSITPLRCVPRLSVELDPHDLFLQFRSPEIRVFFPAYRENIYVIAASAASRKGSTDFGNSEGNGRRKKAGREKDGK